MSKTPIFKQQFLEQLKNLNKFDLPKNQYLIWGSGPLAIRNIRQSNDIDLIVSKHLWDQLIDIYPVASKQMIRIGNIEIWNNCLNLTDKIDAMISNPDIFEGFPFMTLTDTIEWKRFMNREKDLKDIDLIEEYLD